MGRGLGDVRGEICAGGVFVGDRCGERFGDEIGERTRGTVKMYLSKNISANLCVHVVCCVCCVHVRVWGDVYMCVCLVCVCACLSTEKHTSRSTLIRTRERISNIPATRVSQSFCGGD